MPLTRDEEHAEVFLTLGLALLFIGGFYVYMFNNVPRKEGATYKERLTGYFSNSFAGFVLEVLNALFSLLSCVQFIAEGYIDGPPPLWLFQTELVFSVLFALNFATELWLSAEKAKYFYGVQPWVDILTVTPVFFSIAMGAYGSQMHSGGEDNTKFLRFSRIMKITRIFRLVRLFRALKTFSSPIDDAIRSQAINLVSTLLCIVIITTGFVQWVANLEPTAWYDEVPGEPITEISFHDALYFTVVTFTTVGYGDIRPESPAGRMLIVVLICLFAYLVPSESQRLTRLLDLRSKYSGHFRKKQEQMHIVIGADAKALPGMLNFLREFFHEDHGMSMTRVVLVVPYEPDLEWKAMLLQYSGKGRVTYLKGDLMVLNDLARARCDLAFAAFLLSDRNSTDTNGQDARTFMRALALRNSNPKLRVHVQVIEPENSAHFLAVGIDPNCIVCCNDFKLSLLAKAALMKGLSTLLSNLVSSSSLDAEDVTEEWQKQYADGMAKEIYRFPIGEVRAGEFHSDVCRRLRLDGVLLFAISSSQGVQLHPGRRYRIQAGDFGVVIANNQRQVDRAMFGRKAGTLAKLASMKSLRRAMPFGGDTGPATPSLPGRSTDAETRYARKQSVSRAMSGSGAARVAPARVVPVMEEGGAAEGTGDTGMSSQSVPAALQVSTQKQKQTPQQLQKRPPERCSFQHRELLQNAVLQHDRKLPRAIKDHLVVVTTSLDDISFLIEPLYEEYRTTGIVILCPLHPHNERCDQRGWDSVAHLRGVCLLKGYTEEEGAQERAMVHRAKTIIVVTGKEETAIGAAQGDSHAASVDSAMILTVVGLEKLVGPTVRIVAELNDASFIAHYGVVGHTAKANASRFSARSDGSDSCVDSAGADAGMLQHVSGGKLHHELQRCYACGDVVLSQVSELLVCQAFFNSHIVGVMNAMLHHSLSDEVPAGRPRGAMVQFLVPAAFLAAAGGGPTAAKLFEWLLDEHDSLMVGIYAVPVGAEEVGKDLDRVSCVITDPSPDHVITARDLVFAVVPNSGAMAKLDPGSAEALTRSDPSGQRRVTLNASAASEPFSPMHDQRSQQAGSSAAAGSSLGPGGASAAEVERLVQDRIAGLEQRMEAKLDAMMQLLSSAMGPSAN